jgi:hypothetical protein
MQKEVAVEPNRPDVLRTLAEVEVECLQHASGLQVFGLKWPCPSALDYLTLDEATWAKTLDIAEVDEGGRVSAIKVVNKSGRLVFLMAGELLVGCRQDRVINASILVPPKGELCIPVTCVEAGRWSYRSSRFSSGGSSSHGFLRMMISRQVAEHYKGYGMPGSDQAGVWAEVARKMAKTGSRSPSGALQEMYKDYAGRLAEILAIFPPLAGYHGVAFVISGKIVAADLFDKRSTLNKLWSKVIRSYAIDALEEPKEKPTVVQPDQIFQWIKAAGAAKQKWFDSPGVGHDVRIEGEQVVGAALVLEEHPVHLELFRQEPSTSK